MVIVAQLAEHRIVVPSVAGSSPVFHPKDRLINGSVFLYVFGNITAIIPQKNLPNWEVFFCGMLVCLLEPTYVAEVLTVRKICRFGEETQSEFVGTTCGRDEVAFESNFRTFFANQSKFVCFV